MVLAARGIGHLYHHRAVLLGVMMSTRIWYVAALRILCIGLIITAVNIVLVAVLL